MDDPSRLRLIRKAEASAKIKLTRDLRIEEKAARRKWKNPPTVCCADWTPEAANLFVYNESIKRKLKIKCKYECRCYERLQTKTKGFTRLAYTGLVVELEHLKI